MGSQSRKLHGISCSFEGNSPEAQKSGEFLWAICILFVPYGERSQFINFFNKPCEISFLWLTPQLKSSIAYLCWTVHQSYFAVVCWLLLAINVVHQGSITCVRGMFSKGSWIHSKFSGQLYFLPAHRFCTVIAQGLAHIPSVMRYEFYTTSRRVICCSWIQSHDHNTQNFISPSSPSTDFSLADKFIHLIKKMGQCRGQWPSDGLP